MDRTKLQIRAQKLNELKQDEKLDGILALDNRGYSYHNDGFPNKNHNVHSLYRLSQFFFPKSAHTTVVTVEGMTTNTIIQETEDGDILAMRCKKQQNKQNQ